jgi:hypothetical protein
LQKNLKNLSIRDYNSAIRKFCHDNEDTTIYLVGEISHPGISDLDFLVVDNKPIISNDVKPYLMGGNVLIVPKFCLSKIKLLENFNLKLLQGEKVEFIEPPKVFTYVEVIEWLPERILKCMHMLKSENKNSQDVLLLHKSINRSVNKVEVILNKKYKKIEVEFLRKNTEDINNQLVLESSIDVGMTAWNDFSIYLENEKLITGDIKGSVFLNDYYKFSDKFKILMLYFYSLSFNNLQISNKLKEHINLNSSNAAVDKNFKDFILERWVLLNEIYEWFLEKEYKQGIVKYGWFL